MILAAANPNFGTAPLRNPLLVDGVLGFNATLADNTHYGSSYGTELSGSVVYGELTSSKYYRLRNIASARRTSVDGESTEASSTDQRGHLQSFSSQADAVSGFDTRSPAKPASQAAPRPTAFSNPDYEFYGGVYSNVKDLV